MNLLEQLTQHIRHLSPRAVSDLEQRLRLEAMLGDGRHSEIYTSLADLVEHLRHQPSDQSR